MSLASPRRNEGGSSVTRHVRPPRGHARRPSIRDRVLARTVGVALAMAVLAASALTSAAAAQATTRDTGVVSLPVSFEVVNENRSRVACASDGATYSVRGHLIAPSSTLSHPGPVTLYLHGLGFGEFFWDFTAVPGYDYAVDQALAGHASLVIDRLGYGRSGKPLGQLSCIGAQADIAHQLVGELRSGDYQAGRHAGVRFDKVVLAGHSAGGLIAQVEAYSFNDINGLIDVAFSDRGSSSVAATTFAETAAVCATGGQPSGGTNGPAGYAFFGQTNQEARNVFFYNAQPQVVDATLAMRNRDPCGDTGSFGQAIATDEAFVPQITIPVLLVFGDHDALFPPPAGQDQRAMYTGSRDVTLVTLKDTAHAVTLERTRHQFTATVSDFLHAHGFGGT